MAINFGKPKPDCPICQGTGFDLTMTTWVGGAEECDHMNKEVSWSTPLEREHKKRANEKIAYKDVCGKCGAQRTNCQLGSERIPDCLGWARGQNCADDQTGGRWMIGCHVCRMVLVFREARRVLLDDGVCWVNYGDTYAASSVNFNNGVGSKVMDPRNHAGKNEMSAALNAQRKLCDIGLPDGNLIGIPWRFALAMQADGWVLRSDLPWVKRAPMPESVLSRPGKSLEYVFMFTKSSGDYFFDMDAVKPKSKNTWNSHEGFVEGGPKKKAPVDEREKQLMRTTYSHMTQHPDVDNDTRNFRNSDLWFASVDEPHGMTGVDDEMVGLDVTPQAYSGSHYACVDAETEALTRRGWKRHTDIADGELIAAYSPKTDRLVWQPASINRYDFNGQLIIFDKRDTYQLLTDSHRCVVKSRARQPRHPSAPRVNDPVTVKHAKSILGSDSFLMTVSGFDEESTSPVGVDMAALIGWYASEGHVTYTQYGQVSSVHISQSISANKVNVCEIIELLKRLGADFGISTRTRESGLSEEATFTIKGDVKHALRSMCPDKMVTDSLTRLPRNELESLLNAFVSGDGHTRKDDGRQCITQKSKEHIERLQVIAIKLGYRAHLSDRPDDTGCYNLYLTSGKWLNVRDANGTWKGTQYKDYVGVVWCPTVESGFWLARRNGKPFITGNSYPESLIEPLIKCSTSEAGCCPECGKPWKRVKTAATGGSIGQSWQDHGIDSTQGRRKDPARGDDKTYRAGVTIYWESDCACHGRNGTPQRVPCTVLDPFMGSGTTATVSAKLGRRSWGIECSLRYVENHQVQRVTDALRDRPTLHGQIVERPRRLFQPVAFQAPGARLLGENSHVTDEPTDERDAPGAAAEGVPPDQP